MKKKDTKKLIFEKDKISVQEAYEFDLGKIAKNISAQFKMAKNSLKRAFNIGPNYFFKLLKAVATGKSIKAVNDEVMSKQRQLSSQANTLISGMDGAKDLQAFMTIINPAAGALSKGIEYAPDIGEDAKKLSDTGRNFWNETIRQTYYLGTGSYPSKDNPLLLDTGSGRYDSESLSDATSFIESLSELCLQFGKIRVSITKRNVDKTIINKTFTQINKVFKTKKFQENLSKFLEDNIEQLDLSKRQTIFIFSLIDPKYRPDSYKQIEYEEDTQKLYKVYEANEETIIASNTINKISRIRKALGENKTIYFNNKELIVEQESIKNIKKSDDVKEIYAKIVNNINDQSFVFLEMFNIQCIFINLKFILSIPTATIMLYDLVKNSFDNDKEIKRSDFNKIEKVIKSSAGYDENRLLFAYLDRVKEDLFVYDNKNTIDKKSLKGIINKNKEAILETEKKLFSSNDNIIKVYEEENTLTAAKNFAIQHKDLNFDSIEKTIENASRNIKLNEIKKRVKRIEENKQFHINSGNYDLISSAMLEKLLKNLDKINQAYNELKQKNISALCLELEKQIDEKMKKIEQGPEAKNSDDKPDSETGEEEKQEDVETKEVPEKELEKEK
jgi:hypothetical protein